MLSGNIKSEEDAAALSPVPSARYHEEGILPAGRTRTVRSMVQAGSSLCGQSLREGLGLLLIASKIYAGLKDFSGLSVIPAP